MVSYDDVVRTVTPMDLRRSLGRILDEASAGERFLIERDHRPLAVLVSVEDAARLEEDPEDARRRREAAFAAIEEWRERALRQLPDEARSLDGAALVRVDRDARDARDRRRASGLEPRDRR